MSSARRLSSASTVGLIQSQSWNIPPGLVKMCLFTPDWAQTSVQVVFYIDFLARFNAFAFNPSTHQICVSVWAVTVTTTRSPRCGGPFVSWRFHRFGFDCEGGC